MTLLIILLILNLLLTFVGLIILNNRFDEVENILQQLLIDKKT